jgi:hypothetical protein
LKLQCLSLRIGSFCQESTKAAALGAFASEAFILEAYSYLRILKPNAFEAFVFEAFVFEAFAVEAFVVEAFVKLLCLKLSRLKLSWLKLLYWNLSKPIVFEASMFKLPH